MGVGVRGWGLEVRGWGLGVRLGFGFGFGFGLTFGLITTQYFIAYNGITTPIDYWLQRAERLVF